MWGLGHISLFYFFAYGYSTGLAPFIEKIISPPFSRFCSFVKKNNSVYLCGSVSGFVFWSIAPLSTPLPILCGLDYCSYTVSFNTEKNDSSHFILFKNYFGYSFSRHINFSRSLLMSTKVLVEVFVGISLYL